MQLVDMALDDVLYTKTANAEDEEDEEMFLAPNTRGGGGLVVPRYIEASFEELVDKNIGLGQAIYTF